LKFTESQPFKVLIIGNVWPEYRSSAAGLREWNLIQAFQKQGWKVHFASAAVPNLYCEELSNQNVGVHFIRLNDPGFDSWVRELNPDFVVFDRFLTEEQFGWRVQENCPSAVRILDTVDLHFIRRSREAALKKGASIDELSQSRFLMDLLMGSPMGSDDMLRELGSILRCDGTLIISRFEADLLQNYFKISVEMFCLIRFFYPPAVSVPEFDQRSNFVMIGNFRHKPNTDGIHWFRNEIWSKIRSRLPEAQVHIYGAYPSKAMMDLTLVKQGFHVMGSAPDQFEALKRYRVSLAPLRFGAGIKGKITDSWWSGTPVVSTQIGAEGMADDLDWGGAISNDPEEFAYFATQLYSDRLIWEVARNRGLKLISDLYSFEKESPALIRFFIGLRNQLSERRAANWVGRVLTLNQNRSTKYFSKWIEAKGVVSSPQN
jgi:glycosyltransferase involved in cell wall biosynthesis